jgi:CarD family transcriptional regulator
MSAHKLEFKENDHVVYPAHGVGVIQGIETQRVAGREFSVYVISFLIGKMILRVPVKNIERTGLRKLSTSSEIEKIVYTLTSKAQSSKGMWSRRAQDYETRINSGDILSIAKVVRDLNKNVDDPSRSYSERMIYEAALERVATEFSVVKNTSYKEALIELINTMKVEEPEEEDIAS